MSNCPLCSAIGNIRLQHNKAAKKWGGNSPPAPGVPVSYYLPRMRVIYALASRSLLLFHEVVYKSRGGYTQLLAQKFAEPTSTYVSQLTLSVLPGRSWILVYSGIRLETVLVRAAEREGQRGQFA